MFLAMFVKFQIGQEVQNRDKAILALPQDSGACFLQYMGFYYDGITQTSNKTSSDFPDKSSSTKVVARKNSEDKKKKKRKVQNLSDSSSSSSSSSSTSSDSDVEITVN